MPADPILVLAWLTLAHLVGDFILQNEQMVSAKADHGRRGLLGIVVHSLTIGLAMLPIGLAFGGPGWTVVAIATVSHGLVDRIKVILTQRAEVQALAHAATRGRAGGSILGPAWTPIPGLLFVLDQFVHWAILIWAGTRWLSGPPTDAFARAVEGAFAGADPADLHRIALIAAVGLSLLIINIRGGMFFVATLVHPREMVEGTELPEDPGPRPEPRARAWRIRLGPIEATIEAAGDPDAGPRRDPGPWGGGGSGIREASNGPGHAAVPGGSPARVGATIGVLERLLIVLFMITGSEAAIGFVVAAKTLARFRQLDDRDFAEYYLLGTLASVGTAIATGLVARAALATL